MRLSFFNFFLRDNPGYSLYIYIYIFFFFLNKTIVDHMYQTPDGDKINAGERHGI